MTQKLFENQSQHMNASFSNYLSSSEIHFSISCVIRFVHKMSKQLTKFSSKWKKKFAWVESVPNNIHKAYCKYCKEEVKIGILGETMLKDHQKTKKHITAKQNFNSASAMKAFLAGMFHPHSY